MSALDQLFQSGGTNSVGRYSFVDADTLRDPDDPKKTYRLQGYDAPEVAGFKGGKDRQDWKSLELPEPEKPRRLSLT